MSGPAVWKTPMRSKLGVERSRKRESKEKDL